MSDAPEFSRRILLSRIAVEPFHLEIAANEAERAALAGRFGLIELGRLAATVELIRRGGDLILLRAAFEAELVQECVATLDLVSAALSEQFELLYGPPEAEEGAAGTVSDAVAFEPLSGDAIDIGEAVAQEFSLALPPFPRSAAADAGIETPSGEPSPFSELARLLERRRGETG